MILNLGGLSVELHLPDAERQYPEADFAGISISVDDGGHAQGLLLSVGQVVELTAFLNGVTTILTRRTI